MQRLKLHSWCIQILPLTFLLLNCVQFQSTELRPVLPDSEVQGCELPAMHPEFVNFHMADWPDAKSTILEELQSRPTLLPISEGAMRLRIVIQGFPTGKHHADFMEGDPFAFTWRRLSQMAFRWSFGLIPIYEPRERMISFEVWDGARKLREYSYVNRYQVLVGLPAILAVPFVDSRSIEEEARDATAHFLEDACNHPVYALGSVRQDLN